MNRPISTRTHGIIDYVWASTAAAWPSRMEGAPATGRLLRGAGMAATASSLLTRYEAGALRVMPMKGHLAVDAVMCTALMLSPLWLPAQERRWAMAPVVLGAAGLLTGLLTQPRSPLDDAHALRPTSAEAFIA